MMDTGNLQTRICFYLVNMLYTSFSIKHTNAMTKLCIYVMVCFIYSVTGQSIHQGVSNIFLNIE